MSVIRIHGGPTQPEALESLIGLVEGGNLDLTDLGTNGRAFPVEIFDGEGMTFHTIIAAFTGSLDAASALHEALLPGWVTKHQMAAPDRWQFHVSRHIADRDGVHGPHDFLGIGQPARAWLLATLRAYRGTLTGPAAADHLAGFIRGGA